MRAQTTINVGLALVGFLGLHGWLIWRMHVQWWIPNLPDQTGWQTVLASFGLSSFLILVLWPLLLLVVTWLGALGQVLLPRLRIFEWAKQWVEAACDVLEVYLEIQQAVFATCFMMLVVMIVGWLVYLLL